MPKYESYKLTKAMVDESSRGLKHLFGGVDTSLLPDTVGSYASGNVQHAAAVCRYAEYKYADNIPANTRNVLGRTQLKVQYHVPASQSCMYKNLLTVAQKSHLIVPASASGAHHQVYDDTEKFTISGARLSTTRIEHTIRSETLWAPIDQNDEPLEAFSTARTVTREAPIELSTHYLQRALMLSTICLQPWIEAGRPTADQL